jgi:hypothetical protein
MSIPRLRGGVTKPLVIPPLLAMGYVSENACVFDYRYLIYL